MPKTHSSISRFPYDFPDAATRRSIRSYRGGAFVERRGVWPEAGRLRSRSEALCDGLEALRCAGLGFGQGPSGSGY